MPEHVGRTEAQRLGDIIAAAGLGTWEWNLRTGALRLNEGWAAMLGWTLEQLAPVTADVRLRFTHPEDVRQAAEALEQHLAGATPMYHCETRMLHHDGHFVWVLTRGRVMVWTEDGQPEWMVGMTKDISARKQAEVTLRESEAFLELTGRLATVGGWQVDLATDALQWTAETRRIHGVPADFRPTVQDAIAFYAPEARPVIQGAMHQAMAGGAPWDVELPIIRADGRRIWVRATGAVEFQGDRPIRLIGAVQDVTERVAARLVQERLDRHLRLAALSGRIGVWDWDIAHDRMYWDDWMCQLYGVERPDEWGTYETWRRCLHPEDRAATEQAVRDAVTGAAPFNTEFRIVWGDGSVHHIHASGHVIRDAAGAPLNMVGINRDITEQRQLMAALAETNEKLEVTLASIGDGVITADAAGRVTWLNPAAERMTGWPAAEAAGQDVTVVFDILHGPTRERAENPLARCLAGGEVAGLAEQTVLVSRTGQEFAIAESAAPLRNRRGELLGTVLVFHDETEQRRMSGEMSYRASHDMLTGLVNRAEFEQRLRRMLHQAQEDGSQHALLLIDLDQFKIVNDACGHAVGDRLLQLVARMLGEVIRASDTVARLGGDEFAILLDHCGMDAAQRQAQRICDQMEEFRFVHDERRFRIGASIGLVPVDQRWPGVPAAIQAADMACYAAKESGRNRVHVWHESDQALRERHGQMQWATRLEQALEEDRFVLFAQRIVPLQEKPVGVCAEVLLRLGNEDGSLVPPGAFLPAAERFHLASRIDRWVMAHAIGWLRALPSPDEIHTLSINLSGQSVGDRAFHRWALEQLAEVGPDLCARLCLEVTETAAVTNLADAAVFIQTVQAMKVRVALDDFGAGASSFGYLKSLPVDILKIDGQFIRTLLTDRLDAAAVRCFADVAAVAGMQTVAEFVEEPAVLDRLREMGIGFAQGYLIHRPAPIGELIGLSGQPDGAAP